MVLQTRLMHEYDPAKAREYYLRTRELKGRRKGTVEEPSGQRQGRAVSPTGKPRPKGAAPIQKKSVEAEVEALKARLSKLRVLLKKLVTEAKAKSGAKAETPKDKANRNTREKGSKPQTASQKKAAQKRSKEYYEKHKDEELVDLQKKIANIKEKIKKAIEEAKKNSAHKSESTTKPRGDRQNGS